MSSETKLLTEMPNEELLSMLRGLEISLQFIGSRKGMRQTESLIQRCEDERRRRNNLVRENYYKKLKGNK